MLVIVGCEESQVVCKAFRAKGHEAYSCDVLPCSGGHPEWHIQGDVLDYLGFGWDLGIFHPECTYLTVTANKWMKDQPPRKSGALVGQARRDARDEAVEFFMKLVEAPILKTVIENPVGVMSTLYRKPDQIIQPYNFGSDASKQTCLWLKGLPLLKNTEYVNPRITAAGKKRWANQTDIDGSDITPPSKDRSRLRSKTFQGIADALAEQYG